MDSTKTYIRQIVKVLIYIEDHLDEELTMKELTRVACYSPFHFHRIFQALVGETLHKYVRRLRLERAASKLKYTKQPITEIALEANYDTSSAFTRAFKQCMGTTPRNYRLLDKEVEVMTKKIEELANIKPDSITQVAEVDLLFIREFGDYMISSEKAWKKMKDFIEKNHLDQSELRSISITHDDPEITKEENLRFDACIQTKQAVKENENVHHQILKGGKYAIFTHKGSHSNIDETFERIFLKWFPETQESFDDTRPCFCEHFNLEYAEKDESKVITKIHIPLN